MSSEGAGARISISFPTAGLERRPVTATKILVLFFERFKGLRMVTFVPPSSELF